MTIERKTIGATIKQAGEDGSFEAVVATFDVVDHDGDVIEHGAFAGHPVSVLPTHDQQHVPMGKAQIIERGNLAIAVGRFNMEIEAARDWHSALKFDLAEVQPAVQEWSWGFKVRQPDGARRDTIDGQPVRRLIALNERELSPVLRAASIGTGTLSAKAEGEDEPLPLIEQITLATTDVSALVERIHEAIHSRKSDGRRLGKDVRIATVEMAEQCAKLLDELAGAIEAGVMPEDEAARLAARFLAGEARRHGVEL